MFVIANLYLFDVDFSYTLWPIKIDAEVALLLSVIVDRASF